MIVKIWNWFWYSLIGIHKHEWTEWKDVIVKLYYAGKYEHDTMKQERTCTSCKKTIARKRQ